MTSRWICVRNRLINAHQSQRWCTAALHTQNIIRAQKDKKRLEKVETFDYFSKLKEFDSRNTFISKSFSKKWKYEEIILVICISSAFIYFFILREENKTDEILSQPLYTTIPKLELMELGSKIIQLKKEGKDYSAELARLQELKQKLAEKEKEQGKKSAEPVSN